MRRRRACPAKRSQVDQVGLDDHGWSLTMVRVDEEADKEANGVVEDVTKVT